MTRINVYSQPDKDDYSAKAELIGWFSADKATYFKEERHVFDGTNLAGVHLGDRNRGQGLYRTAQGRWVLEHWSDWQGETTRYEFVTDADAKDWLIVNEEGTETLEKYFGEIEEERGPGRPEIGGAVHVRLGELVQGVDAYAKRHEMSRADAIRSLIEDALDGRAGSTP